MESKEINAKSFKEFIQQQGVIGLAVGFILGGATSNLISSFVTDIINPIVGFILGSTKGLAEAKLVIGPVEILWGHFATVIINFLILACVVYYGVKGLSMIKFRKKTKPEKSTGP